MLGTRYDIAGGTHARHMNSTVNPRTMTVTDHFHNEHENPEYRCSSNMFTVSYANPMILRRCQLREDGSVPTLAT